MPVKVIVGEVEDDGGVRRDGVRPVQLEAGQLHGEHLVSGPDRVDHRQPDVAAGHHVDLGGAQDRLQHADRRGLAVGAGDRQPRGRRCSPAHRRGRRFRFLLVQPPGEFDLADHLDTGRGRRRQQRRIRPPTGASDDQLGVFRRLGQPGHQLRALRLQRRQRGQPIGGGVGNGDRRAHRQQRLRGRAPGHPGTGHQHVQPREPPSHRVASPISPRPCTLKRQGLANASQSA